MPLQRLNSKENNCSCHSRKNSNSNCSMTPTLLVAVDERNRFAKWKDFQRLKNYHWREDRFHHSNDWYRWRTMKRENLSWRRDRGRGSTSLMKFTERGKRINGWWWRRRRGRRRCWIVHWWSNGEEFPIGCSNVGATLRLNVMNLDTGGNLSSFRGIQLNF